MRKIVLLLLIMPYCCVAQTADSSIRKTIEQFFQGMHQNDTSLIQQTISNTCTLKSVYRLKDGTSKVTDESMADFFRQVVSLKGTPMEERILSWDIKTDGPMAMAWTPYQFYLNGTFYHCGVNLFVLVQSGETWKIIAITDTRRKQGCIP